MAARLWLGSREINGAAGGGTNTCARAGSLTPLQRQVPCIAPQGRFHGRQPALLKASAGPSRLVGSTQRTNGITGQCRRQKDRGLWAAKSAGSRRHLACRLPLLSCRWVGHWAWLLGWCRLLATARLACRQRAAIARQELAKARPRNQFPAALNGPSTNGASIAPPYSRAADAHWPSRWRARDGGRQPANSIFRHPAQARGQGFRSLGQITLAQRKSPRGNVGDPWGYRERRHSQVRRPPSTRTGIFV